MDHTVPMRFSGYAAMDIGRDNGGVVDRSYESRKPFPFNGTIRKVVFDVKPHLEPRGGRAARGGLTYRGRPRAGRIEEGGAPMAREQTVNVLMAGYLSKQAADEDAASVQPARPSSSGSSS